MCIRRLTDEVSFLLGGYARIEGLGGCVVVGFCCIDDCVSFGWIVIFIPEYAIIISFVSYFE